MKAHINEIMSSIQGEGYYVGVRQIFIRFNKCNLRCTYCDTYDTVTNFQESFKMEYPPGSKNFEWFANPVSSNELLRIINRLNPRHHHSISLTGGEPLIHYQFLLEFLPFIKNQCNIFLETNGTLWSELERILPLIDYISMDIKLPSVTGRELWEEHEKFLNIAKEKNIYTKVVITEKTTDQEIERIINLLSKIDNSIPLILQPVSPFGDVNPVSPNRIILLHDRCSEVLHQVRVIPQTHKMINLL